MEAIDSIYDLDDTIIISNSTKKEDYFKVNAITGTDWNANGTKSFEINNQQTYLNLAESSCVNLHSLRLRKTEMLHS